MDDVKRQLLSECYGFDASSPYFPAGTMVLRFGGDNMANDATMGERGYGLQSGAKLSFEAGDDFNEFWTRLHHSLERTINKGDEWWCYAILT